MEDIIFYKQDYDFLISVLANHSNLAGSSMKVNMIEKLVHAKDRAINEPIGDLGDF